MKNSANAIGGKPVLTERSLTVNPSGAFDDTLFLDIIIIIISLLMSPLQGHRPFLWIAHKQNGP
jgi:hypothetical protein